MAWESTKNPKIREIIEILSSGPHTPTQLAQMLNSNPVTIARYLKILKEDNLVKIKREQNQLYYSLNLNQWRKHVEATMNLAGENFTNKFKKQLKKFPNKTYRSLQEDKKNDS